MVELDIVLLYIWSRVWGIIYVVGPSVATVQTLPGFTIAPCVDSLLCYRSIERPTSILQDSPEV
jgi:hypothetical protein